MKTLIKTWLQLEHYMGTHCNITDIINSDYIRIMNSKRYTQLPSKSNLNLTPNPKANNSLVISTE